MSKELKPSEVLSQAADLIEPEGRWTQRSVARDAAGNVVHSLQDAAVCWCLVGAVQRVSSRQAVGDEALDYVARLRGGTWSYNDAPGRTQAEVVQALRDASKLAAEGGQ